MTLQEFRTLHRISRRQAAEICGVSDRTIQFAEEEPHRVPDAYPLIVTNLCNYLYDKDQVEILKRQRHQREIEDARSILIDK